MYIDHRRQVGGHGGGGLTGRRGPVGDLSETPPLLRDPSTIELATRSHRPSQSLPTCQPGPLPTRPPQSSQSLASPPTRQQGSPSTSLTLPTPSALPPIELPTRLTPPNPLTFLYLPGPVANRNELPTELPTETPRILGSFDPQTGYVGMLTYLFLALAHWKWQLATGFSWQLNRVGN
jgi:hypothetical protein